MINGDGVLQCGCGCGCITTIYTLFIFLGEQVKVLLGKSLKADQLKSKRGGNGSVPKICPVVGCVFTFRTDKQREVGLCTELKISSHLHKLTCLRICCLLHLLGALCEAARPNFERVDHSWLEDCMK